MKKSLKLQYRNGFGSRTSGMTLLEILLYVSISGAVIFAASGLLSIIFEVKQKERIIQSVEEEGTLISYTLNSYIQGATSIYSPLKNKTENNLNISVSSENRDSLVSILFENNKIYVTVNNGEKTALSSSAVVVKDLMFSLSGPSEKGFISYSFMLYASDASGKNHYEKTFRSGASIR
jgi:hypothetical protein